MTVSEKAPIPISEQYLCSRPINYRAQARRQFVLRLDRLDLVD